MYCSKCQILLNNCNWLPSQQKKNRCICTSCLRQDNNQRYLKKKAIYLQNIKNRYLLIKNSVLDYYGGKCQLCQEKDYNKLSLDHINKHGRQHRKSVLKTDSGTQFYRWVFNHKPKDIRILCYNCNCQHNMIKHQIKISNINYKDNKLCKYCYQPAIKYVCKECKSKLKTNYQIDLKANIYHIYGNCCVNCGCNRLEYLTIDHINNDGYIHRKSIFNIYSWLRSNGYPRDNYQILCFNCNYLKKSSKIKNTL